ncbi:unnamed protein product [Ilex paraguariensis]|uniref:Uncharacterized protein n=1 Tax=Ilex paraguariensis TaxID=185542 RepID=A0ABC8QQQ8_9AQUA
MSAVKDGAVACNGFPVGLRVLVVDGSSPDLKILARILQTCHYEDSTMTESRELGIPLYSKAHEYRSMNLISEFPMDVFGYTISLCTQNELRYANGQRMLCLSFGSVEDTNMLVINFNCCADVVSKKILELVHASNVCGISRENVASHLQTDRDAFRFRKGCCLCLCRHLLVGNVYLKAEE